MVTYRSFIAMVLLFFAALSARGQTVEYIHTDALGTPVAVTDVNRNVLERSEYAPYGEVLNRPLRGGPGYTGHVEDAATGLVYMQQRYYDPQIGRFLSVDPVGVSPNAGLNFNRYWYASNNPYKNIDPDGRCDGPSTCAIDRDIAAMNNGDMSKEEFMERSEARAVGAGIGLTIVATSYLGTRLVPAIPIIAKYVAKREAAREALRVAKAQATRGIRSLEKRIAEHLKKIEDFKRNPTVRPGMEGMSEEAIKAQQQARIAHLEKEIAAFRAGIEKYEKILRQ